MQRFIRPVVTLLLLFFCFDVSAQTAAADSLVMAARRSPAAALSDMFSRLTLNAPPSASRRVLILPFESADAGASGRMAAEYAIVHFSGQPGTIVVDRASFLTAMKEIALSQSGAIADSLALAAGRQLSANCLVSGSVAVGPGRKTFFARMVDIETGRILSAAAADIKDADLSAMYKEAFGEHSSAGGALFRSAVLPGWGQFFTGHPGQGTVALVCFLGSAGVLGWSIADYAAAKADSKKFSDKDPSTIVGIPSENADAIWARRANAAVRTENDAASRSTLVAGALAGVWALNIIDAAILGALDAKSTKKMYFSALPASGGGVNLSLCLAGTF